MPANQHFPEILALADEPPMQAEVRIERGGPRLFVQGKETYPLLGWSWGLVQTASIFKQIGIHMLHPILGLNLGWKASGHFDWSVFDPLFAALLRENPQAFFLPRILFDAPAWWKQDYPEERVVCVLPFDPQNDRQYRDIIPSPEGGMQWGIHLDEPSMASDRWQREMEQAYRSFLQYIEASPLRSRILGYQIGSGIYGEWHYFMAEFVPDISKSMQQKLGFVPDLQQRANATLGLLRDPGRESEVISYYHKFHHDILAETILKFARITKEETASRIVCGTFYGYHLENVWIHEGGHLAPELVLNCEEIDFIASPYSYQTTNIPERQWWEHDVVDGAGNWLGRARGIAGDGGYRILLESLKRHGKLYLPELDAGTYLEPPPINLDGTGGTQVEREMTMIGGDGSTTLEGTLQILRRDLGQVFARGVGGWLFDFGPVLRTKKSWYAAEPIINCLRSLYELGEFRKTADISSCAEIAAVYDAKSFFATRHWQAEAPFPQGGYSMDYFSRWFMDSQARAMHRLGAPVDFLYRFDLRQQDRQKYKLLFAVNLFYLSDDDVLQLKGLLKDSGMTVVWFYAPALLSPERVDLRRMRDLIGFELNMETEPGSMLISTTVDAHSDSLPAEFGVDEQRAPRFTVGESDVEVLGRWSQGGGAAFACLLYTSPSPRDPE